MPNDESSKWWLQGQFAERWQKPDASPQTANSSHKSENSPWWHSHLKPQDLALPVEPPVNNEFHENLIATFGWKLHLNFDAQNPKNKSNIEALRLFLSQLKNDGSIAHYKIGDGGGKADDQPGKEATVYVGSRKKAKEAAKKILDNKTVKEFLLPAEDSTLIDDVPYDSLTGDFLISEDSVASIDKLPSNLSYLIMGRFDISKKNPDFHQYGGHGIPLLKVDAPVPWDPREPAERINNKRKAYKALVKEYGTFFTG
ncbi:MAG TPA: hypothetical protein VD999_06415 [Vitreimonas sp.]|nr:hypothetical protein [Vitreimonas sp.]